jgi:TusA-related sulfurtransferase
VLDEYQGRTGGGSRIMGRPIGQTGGTTVHAAPTQIRQESPMIVIDARGLEPPQPFERVMEALCDLPRGESIRLILEREPFPLYRVLDRNGYAHRTASYDDGRYEIDIFERP